mgnify:FL=1|jgi:hypothetical protein
MSSQQNVGNLCDVEQAVIKSKRFRDSSRNAALGAALGSHYPMRLAMDSAIMSERQKLPGLPAFGMSAQILARRHIDIDVEDIHGDPAFAAHAVDFRVAMEKRLGIHQAPGALL